MSDAPKWKGEYGTSERGNFAVIDTIGVPHYYCITLKHLEKSTGIYLDIEEAERWGAACNTCKQNARHGGKILSYKEHGLALLVECAVDFKGNEEVEKELRAWLLKIKDEAERNRYVGFAFVCRQ